MSRMAYTYAIVMHMVIVKECVYGMDMIDTK